MRSLKDLCEGLLAGQNKVLSIGDDIVKTDLNTLFSAKSEEEFNLMFDVLKVNIVGEKHLKTKDNKLYIGFRIAEMHIAPHKRKIIKIMNGNKDAAEIYWSRVHDEVRIYEVSMDYDDFEDYGYVPERWKSQALKILLRRR